jgi:outer membrane receptor protein involved in Fe transport
VAVAVFLNDQLVASSNSDKDGYFSIKPLKGSIYTFKAQNLGFNKFEISGVIVSDSRATSLTLELVSTGIDLTGVTVEEYKIKLFDPTEVSVMRTLDAEQIQNSPTTDIKSIASITAGVYQEDEGGTLNVRGSREEGTQYIVDGVKVIGAFSIPKAAIKEMSVLTGGIPAQFGDATGGIIIITTKGYVGW